MSQRKGSACFFVFFCLCESEADIYFCILFFWILGFTLDMSSLKLPFCCLPACQPASDFTGDTVVELLLWASESLLIASLFNSATVWRRAIAC